MSSGHQSSSVKEVGVAIDGDPAFTDTSTGFLAKFRPSESHSHTYSMYIIMVFSLTAYNYHRVVDNIIYNVIAVKKISL